MGRGSCPGRRRKCTVSAGIRGISLKFLGGGVERKGRGVLQKHVKYFRWEWTHCSHTGTTYKFVLKRYSFLLRGMLCWQQMSLNRSQLRQIILRLSHLRFQRRCTVSVCVECSRLWLRKLL